MKAFLWNLNFSRVTILVTLALSLILLVLGINLHRRRTALEAALDVDVPRMAQDIQVQSRRYTALYAEAEREGLKGQDDPQTYFRSLAAHQKVVLGGINIDQLPTTYPSKGVMDKKYKIEPQSADRRFDRKNIANFMWLIEEQSRRVRVTSISLKRERNLKPFEVGPDRWEWRIEVTSRQKEPPR